MAENMYQVIIMKNGEQIVNLSSPPNNLQATAKKACEVALLNEQSNPKLLLEGGK